MLQRLLVPLDGSRCAERVVPIALRLARANNGTLILLRVVHPNWPSCSPKTFAQELPAMAKFEAERYLVTLSQGAPFQGIRTEIVALFGDEASTILTTAMHQHTDIIVLNAHGYTGVSRWMLGSVAEKVVLPTLW